MDTKEYKKELRFLYELVKKQKNVNLALVILEQLRAATKEKKG